MAYSIIFTRKAKRDIASLEPTIKTRLAKKLKQVLAMDDILPVVRQLVDSRIGTYRLRIGDYRLLFDLEKKKIIVLRVQHRKDIYK